MGACIGPQHLAAGLAPPWVPLLACPAVIRAATLTAMTNTTRAIVFAGCLTVLQIANAAPPRQTRVSIADGRWRINGELTYPGTRAEGLLLNVRMVNSTFEDRNRPEFDADANTNEFIARIPDYVAHGVRAFTLNLQGGMPGYEGAVNSAFRSDGTLRESYLRRIQRVIDECDRHGVVVILGCYYQRQDQIFKDEGAVRAGVVHVIEWIRAAGFTNVVLEISNEFDHDGFDHAVLKTSQGQVELIQLAKKTAPELLVATSGLGHGRLPDDVARASDFLLIHFNGTPVADIPDRIARLKKFDKPIVCNEDDKIGRDAAEALKRSIENGASYGLMLQKLNQTFPFDFKGAADDPVFYKTLHRLSTMGATAGSPSSAPNATPLPHPDGNGRSYFPPPESVGRWRQLSTSDEIRRIAGADPDKLDALREWLLASDDRDFAAVVIANGYIVLEVERGNSAKTDSRRVASVSKAICATVLAIASEQSQKGVTTTKMKFDDIAFDYIPWAKPLSDPRKAQITVKQLLNHTSGICPESTGAPNDGTWEYILGHTGDERTAKLAFDPGTGCGYSTHAFAHAALVCETVTGKPYDQFAIESLLKPLGIEHWWFQFYDGGERYGRHPSHGLGMPARDLARIAYCMLRGGKWRERQIIPTWFIDETAAPTHDVETPELRWKLNPKIFSHAWELPSRHSGPSGRSGAGIPDDARAKPGSGGQFIAFVPSLDLVVTRQTGSSGQWQYEEYLGRACAAILATE
jgi:CubicO group peptidase (beta-lactamase class C family)